MPTPTARQDRRLFSRQDAPPGANPPRVPLARSRPGEPVHRPPQVRDNTRGIAAGKGFEPLRVPRGPYRSSSAAPSATRATPPDMHGLPREGASPGPETWSQRALRRVQGGIRTHTAGGLNAVPPTVGLPGQKSGRRDLNPRPQPWQGCALPAAPRPHSLGILPCLDPPQAPGRKSGQVASSGGSCLGHAAPVPA